MSSWKCYCEFISQAQARGLEVSLLICKCSVTQMNDGSIPGLGSQEYTKGLFVKRAKRQEQQMFPAEADIAARNGFINQHINYVPGTVMNLH